MQKKKKILETTPLMAFFEQRTAQWALLGILFFGSITLIFFWNDWFQRGFEKDSRLTVMWKEDVFRPVRVAVDYGGGKKRAFQGQVLQPLSAASAIRAAAVAGNFSVRFDLRGAIVEVDGVRAGRESVWRWYLNNVSQDRPVQDVMVGGGDILLLQYVER